MSNHAQEMFQLSQSAEDVKTAIKISTNKYDRARQTIKKESLRGQTSIALNELGTKAFGGSAYHTQTLVDLLRGDGYVVADNIGAGAYVVFWPGAEATARYHELALENLNLEDKNSTEGVGEDSSESESQSAEPESSDSSDGDSGD